MPWVATKGRKSSLLLMGFNPRTWGTPSSNEATTPLLCFCQTWRLFLYIIIFNIQKILKSYVLTAYIALHRNLHMRPHVAYKIYSVSPHVYLNLHFKTLTLPLLSPSRRTPPVSSEFPKYEDTPEEKAHALEI
jgi:hypothetical protein